MGWGNSANVIRTNLDASGDSPAAARADLKAALDELAAVCDGRGQVNGVASLDANTKVPASLLYERQWLRRAEYFGAGVFNWVVPAGITLVDIALIGPGGSGAYVNGATSGGGGGAGMVARCVCTVVPGWTLTATVPNPGFAPAIGVAGNAAAGPSTIVGPLGSGIAFGAGGGGGGGPGGVLASPGRGGGAPGAPAPAYSYLTASGGDGEAGGNAWQACGGGTAFQPRAINLAAPGQGGCGGLIGLPAGNGSPGGVIIFY